MGFEITASSSTLLTLHRFHINKEETNKTVNKNMNGKLLLNIILTTVHSHVRMEGANFDKQVQAAAGSVAVLARVREIAPWASWGRVHSQSKRSFYFAVSASEDKVSASCQRSVSRSQKF